MSDPDPCWSSEDAGVWAIGALGENEAPAYAAHLETCAECRAEVASLRVPVDLLGLAAPQVAPPPELRGRIMAVVHAEAQLLAAAGPEADRVPAPPPAWRTWWSRHRPLAAGGGVLAAAACATVLALTVFDGGGDGARTLTGTAAQGAQMVVRVGGDGHAVLRLDRMPASPRGRVYEVWIVRGHVAHATHALFDVRSDGRAQVEIPEKVSGAERLMITDEPQGGSVMPTGHVVANTNLA